MPKSAHLRSSLSAVIVAGMLVGCGDAGDGRARLADTGELPLEDAYNQARSEPRELRDEGGSLGAIVCSARDWGASEVRELTNVTALNANQFIYPGALIQGQGFAEGVFTPITLDRAAGEIYLTGLTLAPDATYRRTVDPVRGDTVAQAISDILSTDVRGTGADLSYSVDQVFSARQMQFSLNADGRGFNASFAADFGIREDRRRNYVLLKFVQRFYDVVFVDPPAASDVFATGGAVADPERQIGPGNPPLYVSKVSYGRMVLLLAESEHSASDVEAALRGAYDGAVSGAVASGFTLRQVMANTSVRYYVKGGDAGAAVRPISAAPERMFDAVRNFLSTERNARYSADNPGAPIAYSLHYLRDRAPARMSYAVDYIRQDCRPANNRASVARRISLNLSRIDANAVVFLNSVRLFDHNAPTSGSAKNTMLTDDPNWRTDRPNTIVVRLGNHDCFGSSLDLAITGGANAVTRSWAPGASHCGWQFEWSYSIDPTTGVITQTN